jgi:ribosomal protein S18 acetylase RimI-like enzyme
LGGAALQNRQALVTRSRDLRARTVRPASTLTRMATSPAEKKGQVRVRRIHRRDLNRTWEFLKLVFRDVNRETVEYQRPRSRQRFFDIYDDEGTEQLLFEVDRRIVGYAECAFDTGRDDSWINPRYFERRGMRPMFVEEIAVHPDSQGTGVGSFMLEQLEHLARLRGCTHLVLEVAENNEDALRWYRKRKFHKLDATIFLARRLARVPALLPPRRLHPVREESGGRPLAAADKRRLGKD